MLGLTFTASSAYIWKVSLWQSLNQHYLLYHQFFTLCSEDFKHLVVSPRPLLSMFNTVNRCYCYTGIKFLLLKRHSGTERIRLSTVPTSALHPSMCAYHTHMAYVHTHDELRTQSRHSGTNKHTKNTNYAYPNTLTP